MTLRLVVPDNGWPSAGKSWRGSPVSPRQGVSRTVESPSRQPNRDARIKTLDREILERLWERDRLLLERK